MPSPFPGMDPYLEGSGLWSDFHSKFLNVCQELLLDRVPGHYDVRLDERAQLVDWSAEAPRQSLPDLGATRDPADAAPAVAPAGTALIEPVTVARPAYVEETVGSIRVMRRPDWELVTAIEMLSPTNKRSPGQGEYLAKCEVFLDREVHLVEIDLLLGGRRLEMRDPLPTGDDYAFVTRGHRRHQSDVYAWGLRHVLPVVPIPLKAPDADVRLDLAAAFNIAYDRGRYARSIQYNAPPEVPLPAADLEWAALLAKGVRGGSASGNSGAA